MFEAQEQEQILRSGLQVLVFSLDLLSSGKSVVKQENVGTIRNDA
jgi:hypothetical protein